MRFVDIHLYGALAEKYGALHQYDVSNAREAVSLLDANHPGFMRDFVEGHEYGLHIDGDWADNDDNMGLVPISREIHIVPHIQGGGPLLFAPLLGAIGIHGLAATIIGGLLTAALFIGLSFLFRPKKPKEEEKRESFGFNGPENVVQQGVPVPLVYGFGVYAGSAVVSSGLQVNNVLGGIGTSASTGNVGFDLFINAVGGNAGVRSTGPDNLVSRQVARVVDLVSEGTIGGLSNGYYSIFLDGTSVLNPSTGQSNFPGPALDYRLGTLGQSYMIGQSSGQENEVVVSSRIKYAQPITRTINNPDADRVRITLSTPGLYESDDKGKVHGAVINWLITISGMNTVQVTFAGKSTGRFQASYIFPLDQAYRDIGWTVTVNRNNIDSDHANQVDEGWWDSYTEITDDRVVYNLSAVFAMTFDAEQWPSIPRRTYQINGIECAIPSNYSPSTGTYSGLWNGNYGSGTTNNPVWILLDLMTHNRRGLGNFLPLSSVDKGTLYRVAQYCDGLVSDGKGGLERRHVCNCQIMEQQEAYDLLSQMAGIFRGFYYWSNGQMFLGADMPTDPSANFTNANVIDGQFAYSGADIRAMHNQALVHWQDPNILGDGRVAIVEDHESISRVGIQSIDFNLIGCTSEAQAHRAGKWALYVEQYESEVVAFTAGLEAAYLLPGSIVRIMDVNIAGTRRGGRVLPGSTTETVIFDAPITDVPQFDTWYLHCQMPDGTVATRQVTNFGANYAVVIAAFPSAPAPDTIWVLVQIGDVEETQWMVTEIKQNAEDQTYTVNAKRHRPDKFAYVENNIPLSDTQISIIKYTPDAPTQLKLKEYLVAVSPILLGVEGTLSWESTESNFIVWYRRAGDNWNSQNVTGNAVNLTLSEDVWEFSVQAISSIGRKGQSAFLRQQILGRLSPPANPTGFRITNIDGVAIFNWTPATELDVLIGGHYELRHSAVTSGASWAGAQVVIASIPGTSASATTAYRVGTWMLKVFDASGFQSPSWATIIIGDADDRYISFVTIVEEPDYLGSHFNTSIKTPEDWLTIGAGGGTIDQQLGNIDTWTDVDVLDIPTGASEDMNTGYYDFEDHIDMGGLFTTRFVTNILAFPYNPNGSTIDDRMTNIDTWVLVDDEDLDLTGEAVVYVRHTPDDPIGVSPTWTAWEPLTDAAYTDRGFQFRVYLSAPIGQNIGVETLEITADIRNKFDQGDDIAYSATLLRVNFNAKFFNVPSVNVTIQEGATGDFYTITNKTREYFDIEIKNAAGTGVSRTFDFQAQGYLFIISALGAIGGIHAWLDLGFSMLS